MAQRGAASWRLPLGLPLAILLLVYFILDIALMRVTAAGCDWAPLWAAGRIAWSDPARAYDFAAVTAAQQPLFGPIAPRPFAYPPTVLMLMVVIARLPFAVGLAAYLAASVAVFARATQRLGCEVTVAFLAPPVVIAALIGQPTLLVGGLVAIAIARLPDAPARAGALLGLCAAIKPQLLILAPLAMCAGRQWKALAASAASAGLLVVLSVATLGMQPWYEWLAALPRFQALVAGFEPLAHNAASPYAAAARLGVSPAIALWIAAPIAIAVAGVTFAKTDDPALRLVALVGGSLLISPYAMHYELAALAPAVAATRIRSFRDIVVPALWGGSMFAHVALLGLLAVYALLLGQLLRLRRQDETIDRWSSGSMLPPDNTATVG